MGAAARFPEACSEAFRMLVDRYGFDGPEVEQISRETYVRYHKRDRTVSIAAESGCAPIVELFYPASETGEEPTWWAERDGVPRCRRIPRLRVTETFSRDDPASLDRYLDASARALEDTEREWLATDP